MTIAYWCVLAAIILPYVWVLVAKLPLALERNFNNHAPRNELANLEGAGQRANWAQQNSWEALPAFAAAVIISHLSGAEQGSVDLLAMIFVVARLCYGVAYIKDWATLRSLVWAIGFFCVIGLFVVAA